MTGSERLAMVRSMITKLAPSFPAFLHLQDFVDGVVGPFASQPDIDAHVLFLNARGDGAALMSVLAENDPTVAQLRTNGALFMTPDEDRAFDCEAVLAELAE